MAEKFWGVELILGVVMPPVFFFFFLKAVSFDLTATLATR